MLIQPTLDTLNQLKLYGMVAALTEQLAQSAALGLPFEDRLGLLVEREVSYRDNRRLTRLLQLAQLKERAALEELDFRARRGLDRSQLASLASCDWIRSAHNLLIHGATGCGKTFLACALAHQACRQGLSALYLRAPRLFDELSLCHADGSFRKRLAAIAKVHLLIIDDFAIAPICSSCSMIGWACDLRSSPVSFRLRTGTSTSATPRLQTPSSIAWCTALTRSIWRVNRSANERPATRARQRPQIRGRQHEQAIHTR